MRAPYACVVEQSTMQYEYRTGTVRYGRPDAVA